MKVRKYQEVIKELYDAAMVHSDQSLAEAVAKVRDLVVEYRNIIDSFENMPGQSDVKNVQLKHLIARYDMDTKLLQNHPENSELLRKRILRHKQMIADLVLSSSVIRKMADQEII